MSLEANSFSAVHSALRAGLGVTILPITAIREDMEIIREGLPDLPNTSVASYIGADHPFIDYLVADKNG